MPVGGGSTGSGKWFLVLRKRRGRQDISAIPARPLPLTFIHSIPQVTATNVSRRPVPDPVRKWHLCDIARWSGHVCSGGPKQSCRGDYRMAESDPDCVKTRCWI